MKPAKQIIKLRRRLGGACVGLLFITTGLTAGAAQPIVWETPRQQTLYEELLRELRCLVCANQSLRDSNAGLAEDLRSKTRELIIAGHNRAEILNYMAERYGEYVRYRPGFYSATVVLWIAPFIVALAGLIWTVARVARGTHKPPHPKGRRAQKSES